MDRLAGVALLLGAAVSCGGAPGETGIHRLQIALGPAAQAAMDADAELQLLLPWWERDFAWADASMRLDGTEHRNARVRYKGASSMEFPWREGRRKLPIKIDLGDGRFDGMRRLSLANGYKDPSLLRDLLTLELLREHGAHAPRAFLCEVEVDGVYWGLYVAVESIEREFLEARFADATGNLYEPFREGADLTEFRPENIEKKTNRGSADTSDLEAFIAALADPATDIDALFDVETFLPWLAVSAVVCHLDSYVAMRHNYYLYNDPGSGKWTFLSWDHNESFGVFRPPPLALPTSHAFDPATPWVGPHPLTERVLAVPAHRERYDRLVAGLSGHPLGEDRMQQLHARMRGSMERERHPHTLQRTATDFARSLDESVESAPGFLSPGIREFVRARRRWLNSAPENR